MKRVNMVCWIHKILHSNSFSLSGSARPIFRAHVIEYMIELMVVEKHKSVKEDVVF